MVATGGTRLGGYQVSQLTNYQVSFVVDLRVLCVCVCVCVGGDMTLNIESYTHLFSPLHTSLSSSPSTPFLHTPTHSLLQYSTKLVPSTLHQAAIL